VPSCGKKSFSKKSKKNSNMALSEHFERIAVISLPQREDRRIKLTQNLTDCGLATEADLTWVEAIDGNKHQFPDWWLAGPGAWGCRASQLKTLREASKDKVHNLLILEDDAVFHRRANQWLDQSYPLLPDGWDLFFLGGQHLKPPSATHHSRLVQGKYITRTHAYAVNGLSLAPIIGELEKDEEYQKHRGWHVDHHLGHLQSDGFLKAFAPTWWLAGQEACLSDISSHLDVRRWWQYGLHYWKVPFVQVQSLSENQESVYHSEETPPAQTAEKAVWLLNIARNAWNQGRLPSCNLHPDGINELWPAGVKTLECKSEISHLADYPANGLFSHSFAP